MSNSNFDVDDATLSVDLSEARQAVKESRFKDAFDLLEIILESQPDNIDSLYLAAVCSRYLKNLIVRNNILRDCWLMPQIWVGPIKSLVISTEIWAMKIKQQCIIDKPLSLILHC
jgi:hypothetical protein